MLPIRLSVFLTRLSTESLNFYLFLYERVISMLVLSVFLYLTDEIANLDLHFFLFISSAKAVFQINHNSVFRTLNAVNIYSPEYCSYTSKSCFTYYSLQYAFLLLLSASRNRFLISYLPSCPS